MGHGSESVFSKGSFSNSSCYQRDPEVFFGTPFFMLEGPRPFVCVDQKRNHGVLLKKRFVEGPISDFLASAV